MGCALLKHSFLSPPIPTMAAFAVVPSSMHGPELCPHALEHWTPLSLFPILALLLLTPEGASEQVIHGGPRGRCCVLSLQRSCPALYLCRLLPHRKLCFFPRSAVHLTASPCLSMLPVVLKALHGLQWNFHASLKDSQV